MSASHDAPISDAVIAELLELDGDGPPLIFRELVDLFNESTPQLLSRAVQAGDNATQLVLIAHTLKGSCSNFGATPMESLCRELEAQGRAGKTDGARPLIDAIELEYFKVRAALAPHCARHKQDSQR